MRAKTVVLLIGAFAAYWLTVQLAERGLLTPILLVGVLSFAWRIMRKRKRDPSRVDRSPLPSERQALTEPTHSHGSRVKGTQPENSASRDQLSIDAALERLPEQLRSRSGSVFYAGKEAFTGQRPVYFLGLNPGGNPEAQADNTIADHITEFRSRANPWSASLDDSWEGAKPGTWGMQPRVLHMLTQLGFDPRAVPASNVVFVRTRDEATLKLEKAQLLKDCWPVHQAVIENLGVRAVVCFGGTAGRWVRERTGANKLFDRFKETNDRGWTSEAHRSADGRVVVTVTHPGRADWRNPAADPTSLVRRALT